MKTNITRVYPPTIEPTWRKSVSKQIQFYGAQDLEHLPQLQGISASDRLAMKAVAQVLPFRTNNYVVEELIDWTNIPDDPIFRLTFPHPDMLLPQDLNRIIQLLQQKAPGSMIREAANQIRLDLNPHPGGQKQFNVPLLEGEPVPGIQHKYRETVLVFPTAGQTCHAYCTFCFRWPQFVGLNDLRFATRESGRFQTYLQTHHEVTDVLFTGGDPMTMKARQLALYIEPLLGPEFEHIQTIRIGTKSVAYWPYRFITDPDAGELLHLFEQIVQAGKHLAIMGHYTHWKELDLPIAEAAIRRIRATGAEIRCQAPLVRHVNDAPEVWVQLVQRQVHLGCIPYYMFVERPTGAQQYFEIPLVQAWQIYQAAFQRVSGLGRTLRGPVMSALPGKILVEGIAQLSDEPVFVLSFLQGRDPDWCKRPFFAQFNPDATWVDDLLPAFEQRQFFFEQRLKEILRAGGCFRELEYSYA